MSVLPPTSTTAAQRGVELELLEFLQQYYIKMPAQCGEQFHHDEFSMGVEDGEGTSDEKSCDSCSTDDDKTRLHRGLHEEYLKNKLLVLSHLEERLYNSQPWIVYWALHAADVLGILDQLYERVFPDALAEFLLGCLQEFKKDPGGNSKGECGDCGETSNTQTTADVWRPAKLALLWSSGEVPRVGCADDCDDGECLVGFAGGQLAQLPHLGVSYAAVCAMCILARPEYLHVLPRAAIKRWLLSLRSNDGGFRMHNGGEVDIRGSYCAAVINALLQLDEVCAYKDGRPDAVLTEHTARFVASCQTHEGGFACSQYASEAHGAYTHCAIAALMLMRCPHLCNYASLRRWLAARQLKFEGGFNGRTNKLVDSCYSYWVGVSHVLLRVGEVYKELLGHTEMTQRHTARDLLLLDYAQLIDVTRMYPVDEKEWLQAEEAEQQRAARVEEFLWEKSTSSSSSCCFFDEPVGDFYFNQRRLLLYVLSCCQNTAFGGLMDKPGFPNDLYHTCYSLSGISAAQNLQYLPRNHSGDKFIYSTALSHGYIPTAREGYGVVLATRDKSKTGAGGDHESLERLCPINPIFNICRSRVSAGLRAWGSKSFLL